MITDKCNLKCSYCFANEFVNKTENEISLENFISAMNFITQDKTERMIGLIGGEPTTHSNFAKILKLVIENEDINIATLYTNAIDIKKYANEISHPKYRILVNCNSPDDIGQDNFNKMCESLDELILFRYMRERVTLGINMYKPNFEYKYIIALLKKYGFKRVRTSITVPNTNNNKNIDAHKYFQSIKEYVKQFYFELLESGIVPYYDCNKIPTCLLSENDYNSFEKFISENRSIYANLRHSDISSSIVRCAPVIDILQDLKAVRCFGLSKYTKIDIGLFSGIEELKNYYKNTIDDFAFNTAYSSKCVNCHNRTTEKCMGGCLAFKIHDIINIRDICNRKMLMKGEYI